MKQLWNSFKIAFSMYSKIPMPKSQWTKENMRYIMCFFPLIGAVIGGLTWLWGIWGMELVQSRLLYVILLVLIPVFVTGRAFRYSSRFEFLSAKGTETGNTKGFQCRSLCCDYRFGIFSFVSGCLQ